MGDVDQCRYDDNLTPHRKPILTLSPQFKEAFNTVIISQTRRLVETVSFLVQARTRNTQAQTVVTTKDVGTAVDILGLPRHFAQHFSTLPHRIPVLRESLEGKSITSTDTQDQDDEKTIRYSRFTKTKLQRLDKWDINHGFEWDREEDPRNEELDDTLSTPADDTTDISSPDLDETLEPMEDESDGEEDSEGRDGETTLLDAETAYLEAYDAQLSCIELDRLHTLIKRGARKAHAFHRAALKTFPSKHVDRARKKWSKTQRELMYKTEERRVDYGDGEEGEMEPREWEGFWKRNPNPPRSQRVLREEEERKGGMSEGKKTRSEEDEDESEWSVYSD